VRVRPRREDVQRPDAVDNAGNGRQQLDACTEDAADRRLALFGEDDGHCDADRDRQSQRHE